MNARTEPGTTSCIPRTEQGAEKCSYPINTSERDLPDLLHDALLAGIRGPRTWTASPTEFIDFLATRGITSLALERSRFDVKELRARFALYRDLVHKRVRGVLDNCLPRTLLALGSRLDATLEHFVCAYPWPSPHLRDVVADFVRFGSAEWSVGSGFVPYLRDLAQYESARLEVGSAIDDSPLELSEVSSEVTMTLRASARLLQLQHAVHQTAEDHPTPLSGVHYVLLYRDATHEVQTLQLSALAAAVIGGLCAGLPLARAAERGLVAAGLPSTPEHVAEVATLLNELFTRDIFTRRQVATTE